MKVWGKEFILADIDRFYKFAAQLAIPRYQH